MAQTTQSKADLRRALRAARDGVSIEERTRRDAAIGAALLAWDGWRPGLRLGAYWPLRGESDLRSAYAALRERGVLLALPAVTQRDAALGFRAWTPGDPLERDAAGVPAPPASAAEVIPDAILLPCLGFNADRIRLGYGGGYYDRTLALPSRPLAIGVADRCTRAAFDAEPHDVPLDAILTEAGWEGAPPSPVFSPVF